MAPARPGASGAWAADAGLGALGMPALRSLVVGVDGPDVADVADEAAALEAGDGLALLEGLEVVAQPVSHAVTATRKRSVIFMGDIGDRWLGGG